MEEGEQEKMGEEGVNLNGGQEGGENGRMDCSRPKDGTQAGEQEIRKSSVEQEMERCRV